MVQRPGQRPMRALPVLEPRRAALEKCVFCPKLCRSACPVSNADTRETVTPWGKMSMAWMAAHGDVPADVSHAAPAWACTGCLACRESCDHRNPVAGVLLDARDALMQKGAPIEAAARVRRRFARHDRRTRIATFELARHPRARAGARGALVIGCGYVRSARAESRDAVTATAALLGEPVDLVPGCCGLPLRLAGDRLAFIAHARGFARSLAGSGRVVVVDAGCAHALMRLYPEAGVALDLPMETLVELAARSLGKLSRVGNAAGPVRWHDPCQLGRGLGIYDAPRAALERLLGRPPAEFDERRERAACSGAGGLLPSTMPEVARRIAGARLGAHARSGGGQVVTACASSLRAFRGRAGVSGATVVDFATWLARGCRDPNG